MNIINRLIWACWSEQRSQLKLNTHTSCRCLNAESSLGTATNRFPSRYLWRHKEFMRHQNTARQESRSICINPCAHSNMTHSSVTLCGMPRGKPNKCLLLQRTTVSRQVHSSGHSGLGTQLMSSSMIAESIWNRYI